MQVAGPPPAPRPSAPRPSQLPETAIFSTLPPVGIALVIAFLVLSLGAHEAAHGWAALKCGDRTARDLGRITLNPLAHIDLFMTVVLPAITLTVMGFPFGGAKPVPVNFHNLRKPYRDMAIVALAGPASNLVLAVVFAFAYRLMVQDFAIWNPNMLGAKVIWMSVLLNVVLAAFNLMPIPPLDGSRVMAWLLPQSLREPYHRLEAFGLLIVIACIAFFPPFMAFVRDAVVFLMDIVFRIVSLGGLV